MGDKVQEDSNKMRIKSKQAMARHVEEKYV
jgi:hypothetical protein